MATNLALSETRLLAKSNYHFDALSLYHNDDEEKESETQQKKSTLKHINLLNSN